MREYINKEEFYNIEKLLDTDIIRKSKAASWLLDQVLHDIKAQPSVDVVKVTRCKDCILHEDYKSEYNNDFCYCKRFDTFVNPNGFCDCGKDKNINND